MLSQCYQNLDHGCLDAVHYQMTSICFSALLANPPQFRPGLLFSLRLVNILVLHKDLLGVWCSFFPSVSCGSLAFFVLYLVLNH